MKYRIHNVDTGMALPESLRDAAIDRLARYLFSDVIAKAVISNVGDNRDDVLRELLQHFFATNPNLSLSLDVDISVTPTTSEAFANAADAMRLFSRVAPEHKVQVPSSTQYGVSHTVASSIVTIVVTCAKRRRCSNVSRT
jgi:hypothetical protein